MPPDLPNELELMLKKRARRRLVGAIALVLLMVIILPQVLQDRALLAQHEPIKITMPELAHSPVEMVVNNPVITSTVSQQQVAENNDAVTPPSVAETLSDNKVSDSEKPLTESESIKKNDRKSLQAAGNKVAVKTPEASQSQIQIPIKSQESFTVQVGVYSDADNVKRLQEQLKQAGFSTHTEKVKSPKGDSLRLKVGNFKSRQDALTALDRIKAIGLPGIVVGNE